MPLIQLNEWLLDGFILLPRELDKTMIQAYISNMT
jgi:hypothetical protein